MSSALVAVASKAYLKLLKLSFRRFYIETGRGKILHYFTERDKRLKE
jgi:hypothetical protein